MRYLISHTNLGKNIRFLRQQNNLSPEVFAEIFGILSDDVISLETEEVVDIDGAVFQKICEFYHMDMEDLVDKNMKEFNQEFA